jgi:RNA polymerase sigma factor (sigma-70 family)
MLRTQSDARLVDLVRAGHAAAFEAIVQRYRRPLLKYCGRLLPASRAEDAVQQTFLKAYQSMISGDAEINLRPWLYKIAHNASLNLLRQNGWNYDQLDENFDGVQRPDQALELRERLRATVKAVKKLPERQRDAVLLREVEGLSYEEIGAALGVGDGAVRQLLHRARATLRAGATAVTPVGLVERIAMALGSGGADPATRVAETAAGIGAGAGVIKLGAAVLATGAIATGAAVSGPLSHDSHRAKAEPVAAKPAAAAVAPIAPSTGARSEDVSTVRSHRGSGHGKSGSGKHGHRGRDGSGDGSSHHGSGDRHGSSGGQDRSGSGSGENHSGSGDRRGSDGGGDRSGSGDRHSGSGSDDSGGDHSGSTTTSGDGGDSHSGDGGGDSGDGGGSGGSGDGGGETMTTPLPTPTAPLDSSGDSSGDSGK